MNLFPYNVVGMVVFIFFSIFLFLLRLQSLFIFGGDSAEFSLAGQTWSIPHPPGYPLYSLLANSINLLPIETTPWRISILSSLPSILSGYILYRILRRFSISHSISLICGVFFLILFPVWLYSIVPEVFLLNIFLVVSATYALILFSDTNKKIYIFIFAYLIGVSFSHHHIFMLFIPGWIYMVMDKYGILKKYFKTIIFFIIMGAIFYLYAPIASIFNPPLDYENAKTIEGFIRLATRATYGTFNAYNGVKPSLSVQLSSFLTIFLLIFRDFQILGIFFVSLGLFQALQVIKKWSYFFLIALICHLLFFYLAKFDLSNSFHLAIFERFLISLYFILIIYGAIGLSEVIRILNFYFKIIVFLLFLSSVVLIGLSNYKSLRNIHNLSTFNVLGSDIIKSVPYGSILYVGNDHTVFPTLYHLFGLKKRQDVVLIQMHLFRNTNYISQFQKKYPHVYAPNNLNTPEGFKIFLKRNESYGIYFETPLRLGYWLPHGLLWKYYSTKELLEKDLKNESIINEYLWNSVYKIPKIDKDLKRVLHLQVIQDYYIQSYISFAKILHLSKQYEKEKEVLIIAQQYRPQNKDVLSSLLNLYIEQKDCTRAGQLLDINNRGTRDGQNEVLYHKHCDKKRPN